MPDSLADLEARLHGRVAHVQKLHGAELEAAKRRAHILLDDDYGVSWEAYRDILDSLPVKESTELDSVVEAVDDRFYLPQGALAHWRTQQTNRPT